MIDKNTAHSTSAKSLALAITGIDAGNFLQGQLTCDVLALNVGQSTLGAYCNIKGKVVSLFKLHRTADGFILQMPAELLDTTKQELQKYAVFSKVSMELVDADLPVETDLEAIRAKMPTLYTQTIGTFFPHDLNLPDLNAVSFTKGCYRGQEIVARMQHRGNLKRSMYLFTTSGAVNAGDFIVNEQGTNAGTVVRTAFDQDKTIGLAVITDEMQSHALSIHGFAIILQN